MHHRHALFGALAAACTILAACGPRTNPDLAMRQAVAQTIAALPTMTRGPAATPLPSSTPFVLAGLFCEYEFCIGHPPEMAFFDVSAQQNPGAPSVYTQGILAAYKGNLFIQLMWQIAPGTTDATFMFDLILDEEVDIASGSPVPANVNSVSATFVPISSTATSVLPYGGVAAWTCKDRAFAWKAYTPDPTTAESLLNDAIRRFVCQ